MIETRIRAQLATIEAQLHGIRTEIDQLKAPYARHRHLRMIASGGELRVRRCATPKRERT